MRAELISCYFLPVQILYADLSFNLCYFTDTALLSPFRRLRSAHNSAHHWQNVVKCVRLKSMIQFHHPSTRAARKQSRASRCNLGIRIGAVRSNCNTSTTTALTRQRFTVRFGPPGSDNLTISEAVCSPNQFSSKEETKHMDKTSWVTESFYLLCFSLSLPNR